METLYSTDEGGVFIGKINANFSEVSPSSVSKTITIPMTRGGLSIVNGLPEGALTNPSEFTNKLHSISYIHITGTVSAVTISVGTASIYCFDSSFSFLGVASGTTLVSGTSFIRISVTGQSAYASIPSLTITVSGDVEFYKVDHTKKTATFFCFETTIPKSMGSDGSYYGSTGIHYDQGFIKLPPNYTANGDPVPLALYFPGSNGYQWGETSVISYDTYFDFICDNGYAVACCSGLTDYWMDSTNNPFYNDNSCKKNSKWSATVASAFCNLYDHVVREYNIKTDGVYTFGKSTGGMGTAWFSTRQPIKVRCGGLLAPSTFMSGGDMRWGFVSLNVEKQWQLMLGCPNYNDFTSSSVINANSADAARLVANAPYYVQWEPFTLGTEVDLSELLTECAKVAWNNYDNTSAITSLLSGKGKSTCAPMKIWLAQDDDVIDWGSTVLFQNLVKANNGICDLRQMPSGTGKHHSVDYDSNAPKVDYTTKYNGVVNVPVAYAELVDWFNRW